MPSIQAPEIGSYVTRDSDGKSAQVVDTQSNTSGPGEGGVTLIVVHVDGEETQELTPAEFIQDFS